MTYLNIKSFQKSYKEKYQSIVILLSIVIICLSSIVFSQQYNPPIKIQFEHISVDDGLSQNTVTSIAQDNKGFLWFGTQEGLNRFNGYDFQVFEHNPSDTNSISDNYIYSILVRKSGDIWIGTNGGGVNIFDSDNGGFTRYISSALDSMSLSHNLAYTIYEDKSGIVWVGTWYGLNKFNDKSKSFERYYFDTSNHIHNTITVIYEDNKNQFWIGTQGGGLNRLNRENGKVDRFLSDPQNLNSLSNNNITAIHEDSSGKIWIGTQDGLNMYDKANQLFHRYYKTTNDPYSLNDNYIQSIYEDKNGYLWIGTQSGGINIFNKDSKEFYHYYNNIEDPSSLSNNNILNIYEDKNGTIWLGTFGGGINKYNKYSLKFEHVKMVPFAAIGSNKNFVSAIEEDKSGMWIGTYGHGLYRRGDSDGSLIHYTHLPENKNSISSNYITSMKMDKNGYIWIGTYGGGLNKVNLNNSNKTYSFDRITMDDIDNSGNSNILKLFEDKSGYLWIGSHGNGLIKYNPQSDNYIQYKFESNDTCSISANYIFDIDEDNDGNIWIATNGGGLNKLTKDSGCFSKYLNNPNNVNSLSHNCVYEIYIDKHDRIWIGTGYGLNHLSTKTDNFERFDKEDGLPNNLIYEIIEGGSDSLWISTNNGITLLDVKTKSFKNFNVQDGLQSNEFNNGASLLRKNGDIIFGGINGISNFNPSSVIVNKTPPLIAITDFTIDDNENLTYVNINDQNDINLSYKNNSFTIEFSALDFVRPSKNQYRYQLEGFDGQVINSKHKRTAKYTQVPPGKYVFKVQASNNDGVWNYTGRSLNIIIKPPFWATIWFKTAVIVVILLFIYLIHLQRIKYLTKKQKILETQIEQKSIATQKLQNALNKVEELKLQLKEENIYLQEEINLVHNFENIITQDKKFKSILGKVEKVSTTEATVLILGESGTGKELIARAIHNISNRKDRPLVKVNCAAIPDNLVESELFGHEKGSFTGAVSKKIGRFELAHNGTIFLDEIGDLSLDVQSKLLRVIQEGEFERLGGIKTNQVNVRIIAATNRNLEKAVKDGQFRDDLYFRLNVFPILLPPLRERKEDIALLVKHFINIYSKKIGKQINTISQNTLDTLINYSWPGNIRELENIIERAVIVSPPNKLKLGNWFTLDADRMELKDTLTYEENERQNILKALNKTNWRISGEQGAAKLLNIKPTTLDYRIKKLGIKKNI